ncbi:MAG: FAD-dependent oxidoreductase [Archangium sp.]|nr:FAD-dependent oxidoreductase [Archangium sp.]
MANIAIIGGGVAGLTAGYSLSRDNDVTLFEKSGRIGGNAYSHTTKDGDVLDIAVAAFGRAGYKNFYALLDELGIPTARASDSYMSFHDLERHTGIYVSPNMRGLIAQNFQLLKPRSWSNAFLMLRGLKRAQALLDRGALRGLTLEQAFAQLPEFSGDVRLVFLCTLCLLSSMSAPEILCTPAEFFFNKLKVHNDVISIKAFYSVRCVSKGTQSYVNALAAGFRKNIVLNADVASVRREGNRVQIRDSAGHTQVFDKVVFACPAPTALRLLEAPTDDEKRLLSAWKYKSSRLVVHRDHSAFPERSLMQAYTFLYTQKNGVLETSVNGALWHEPQVRKDCDYISSQHPNFPIRDELVEFETTLWTPIFDFESISTIAHLPSLNGVKNTFYCGSHFGFGLHEDAVTSALQVVDVLGRRSAA